MKKRTLSISVILCMVMAFIPFGVTAGAEEEYLARFGAQMRGVDGWGLGEIAETTFKIGEPAMISIDFEQEVSFGDGNYIAIETNLPNPYEDVTIFTDTEIAEVLSFKLDGVDVEMGDALINAEGMDAADGSGPGLRLTLTNKWNGDIVEQPVDPVDLGEFTTLEIEFIIYGVGDAPAIDPGNITIDEITPKGNAWIGGTFFFSAGHPAAGDDDDPDMCDWWDFPEQSVEFEIGTPFTVTLDVGSDTLTHDVASNWDGFIITVDTDNPTKPELVDVYIESIKADGNEIKFNPNNVIPGVERGGLRVAMTSAWADDPVVDNPQAIGTFSKLEVTLVIVELDADNPFGNTSDAPAVEETPAVAPPPVIIDTGSTDSGSDTGGSESSNEQPGWLVPVMIAIGVVLIAVIVVIIMANTKKKKAQ